MTVRGHGVPPSKKRELMLVLAAAEERLMAAHAAAARDFVLAVGAALPLERALEIYLRVLDVPARDQRAVVVRALCMLRDSLASTNGAAADGNGVLRRLSRRLGGRRDATVRDTVAAATEAARAQVQGAYQAGALELIDALRGTLEPVQAVQVYIESLEIGPGWGEVVFHDAVAVVAA